MIKLNLTHTFTGRDIKDAACPDLLYKAYVHWIRDKSIDFIRNDYQDVSLALDTLDEILVSVTYEDVVYPVTREWLEEFQQQIEEQNPGMSEQYIISLARSIVNHQWIYQDERLKNSQRSLAHSENGKGMTEEKMLMAESKG